MLSSTFLAVAAIFSAVNGLPFTRNCDGAHCKRTSSTLSGASALQASTDYVVCSLSQQAELAVAALGLTPSSMAKIVCVEPGVSASTTSSNSVSQMKPLAAAQLQSLGATATADSSSSLPSTAVLAEQQFHSSSTTSSPSTKSPSTNSASASSSSSSSYYKATYTPLPASYSASATASAASSTSTTTVCNFANPKSCSDQQLALNAHNVARASHHVEPLVWSDKLAISAATWANKCEWAHSQGSLFDASYVYGENLFASTLSEPDISMASVVAAFMDEEAAYDYNNPSFSPNAGQFTQVVWAATREVGCAIVTCNLGIFGDQATKSTLSVCNYYPSGNYINEFSDNVHAP